MDQPQAHTWGNADARLDAGHMDISGSHSRLHAILAAADQGLIVVDQAGQVNFANPAAARLFGCAPKDLMGRAVRGLLPTLPWEELDSNREAAWDAHAPGRSFEVVISRPDAGSTTLQATVSRLERDGLENVVALKDISDPARYRGFLERQVARRTEELAAALVREQELRQDLNIALLEARNLIDVRSNLISVVSHEFRTPLAVIQSSVDLLEMYHERLTPAERRERLKRIRVEIHHMVELIQDAVHYDRACTAEMEGEREAVDIMELSRSCVAQIDEHGETANRVTLRNRRADTMLMVHTTLIRRILVNLLSNASLYSPPGSPIEMEVAGGPAELVLVVANPGEISPDLEMRMFDPFVRGPERSRIGGTGLGLAIVKAILRAIQGGVELVRPRPGWVALRVHCPLSQGVDSHGVRTSTGLSQHGP